MKEIKVKCSQDRLQDFPQNCIRVLNLVCQSLYIYIDILSTISHSRFCALVNDRKRTAKKKRRSGVISALNQGEERSKFDDSTQPNERASVFYFQIIN